MDIFQTKVTLCPRAGHIGKIISILQFSKMMGQSMLICVQAMDLLCGRFSNKGGTVPWGWSHKQDNFISTVF